MQLQEALLNVHPYNQLLLAIIISSLLTILCKNLCYFQAGGKQSEPFYHSSMFQLLLRC
jgi:hypothetical protein